jgi:hypothetical protein
MATVFTARMSGALADHIEGTGLMQDRNANDAAEREALAAWDAAKTVQVKGGSYYVVITGTEKAFEIFNESAEMLLSLGGDEATEAELRAARTWLERSAKALTKPKTVKDKPKPQAASEAPVPVATVAPLALFSDAPEAAEEEAPQEAPEAPEKAPVEPVGPEGGQAVRSVHTGALVGWLLPKTFVHLRDWEAAA